MTEEEIREFLVGLGFTGKQLDLAIEIARRESAPLTSPDATVVEGDRPRCPEQVTDDYGTRCWQDEDHKWHHNPFLHRGCILR